MSSAEWAASMSLKNSAGLLGTEQVHKKYITTILLYVGHTDWWESGSLLWVTPESLRISSEPGNPPRANANQIQKLGRLASRPSHFRHHFLILAYLPAPPKVPLFKALWSLLDSIWIILNGSWGVLVLRAHLVYSV